MSSPFLVNAVDSNSSGVTNPLVPLHLEIIKLFLQHYGLTLQSLMAASAAVDTLLGELKVLVDGDFNASTNTDDKHDLAKKEIEKKLQKLKELLIANTLGMPKDGKFLIALAEAIMIAQDGAVQTYGSIVRQVQMRGMEERIHTDIQARLKIQTDEQNGVPTATALQNYMTAHTAWNTELATELSPLATSATQEQVQLKDFEDNFDTTYQHQHKWAEFLATMYMEAIIADMDVVRMVLRHDPSIADLNTDIKGLVDEEWYKDPSELPRVGAVSGGGRSSSGSGGTGGPIPQNSMTLIDAAMKNFQGAGLTIQGLAPTADSRAAVLRTLSAFNGDKRYVTVALKGSNLASTLVSAVDVVTPTNLRLANPIAKLFYLSSFHAALAPDDDAIPATGYADASGKIPLATNALKDFGDKLCVIIGFTKEERANIYPSISANGDLIAANKDIVEKMRHELRAVIADTEVMQQIENANLGFLLNLVFVYATLRASIGFFGASTMAADSSGNIAFATVGFDLTGASPDYTKAPDILAETDEYIKRIDLIVANICIAVHNLILAFIEPVGGRAALINSYIATVLTASNYDKTATQNLFKRLWNSWTGSNRKTDIEGVAAGVVTKLQEAIDGVFATSTVYDNYYPGESSDDVAAVVMFALSQTRPLQIAINDDMKVVDVSRQIVRDSYYTYPESAKGFFVVRRVPDPNLAGLMRSGMLNDVDELLVEVTTKVEIDEVANQAVQSQRHFSGFGAEARAPDAPLYVVPPVLTQRVFVATPPPVALWTHEDFIQLAAFFMLQLPSVASYLKPGPLADAIAKGRVQFKQLINGVFPPDAKGPKVRGADRVAALVDGRVFGP
jgi:hypothetical protein